MRQLLVVTSITAAVAITAIATTGGGRTGRAAASLPVDLGPVRGFVANHGQWAPTVLFAATTHGTWLHVTSDGFRTGRGKVAIAVHTGAGAASSAGEATGTQCHFLFGADPDRHVRSVPVHGRVRQSAVAPDVDLELRASAGGDGFAYDLHVGPGADLEAVEFEVRGVERLAIDARTGELVLTAAGGELRQSAPIAFVGAAEDRRSVPCTFELRGERRYGFHAPTRDAGEPLFIDPDLRWSTTFGGTAHDTPYAVAVAGNGDTFVAGSTQSTSLPGTAGVFGPTYNGANPVPFVVGDGFVARLAAANGALLWCTYLGGAENDRMVAAGAIGDDVVVTGWTSSTDFPTTPGAFDTTHNGTGDGYQYGGGDIFVTRLAANGQSLVWSSFLGGAMLEYPSSMAIASNGEVAVSGHVHSLNFPVTPGAHRSTRLGYSDYFVTRFAADGGSLVGSTYAGGSDHEEYCHAMAITPDDDIVVAGPTDSALGLATPGAYDTTFNGGTEHFADGFAARFDRTCSTLRWCTYLGTPSNEYVRGMVAHADGTLTFSGQIDGPGLPTSAGVFGPQHFGGRDGFLWKLSGDGTTSLWASYYGGGANDRFERCADLGGGRVAAVGSTLSANAPLSRGAYKTTVQSEDGWLVVASGDGSVIEYATALGAQSSEWAVDVARLADGDLVVTGHTWSSTFPITPGGTGNSGGGDAFCVQLAALPVGTARHGAPSGACARNARVRARSGPFVGEAAFALSCGGIPAGAPALAAAATAVVATPTPVLGIDAWLDLNTFLTTIGVGVDVYGSAVLPLPLPPTVTLTGASIAVQFAWQDTCAGQPLGASDVLVVTVQP